uniref:CWF21 domain-containing protein n=1 Tax=Spongospora subterranea TaxID=70186 RepID=A0A0H5RMP4_9EUKA|eukprot:CRZ09994.1 hypothetical protein [Spongospora subterranea]
MSYNGIGLATARGSGTNGHVTRNLSSLRRPIKSVSAANIEHAPPVQLKADPGLIEHNQKRQIAVLRMKKRLELEDQGLDEDQIVEELAKLTQSLQKHSTREQAEQDVKLVMLEKKNEAMRDALGIGAEQVARKPMERVAGQAKRPWLDRGDGPLPVREKRPKQHDIPDRPADETIAPRRTIATAIIQIQLQN